jgi:putative NIF3 family GTP cyclohydrolase 1 type 2
MLGFKISGNLTGFGKTALGQYGHLAKKTDARSVADHISNVLKREVLHISVSTKKILSIGWCTGGAQSYIQEAIKLGLDAYISGEISESTVHYARENNIHYFAAGHHATERYGVKALSEHLGSKFPIECEFIDLYSPA